MDELRLIIFCKAPIPGEVKTRLIAGVGAGSAANIHARLATETIGDCLAVAEALPRVKLELWCSPDTEHVFFQAFTGKMSLHQQQGKDLGERMAHALCAGESPAMLIGTDCPPVNRNYLLNAADQLRFHPFVIAPAEDGGYGLIGMQSPAGDVFRDIQWSTEYVLQETLQRCRDKSIKVLQLPEIWDVDEPADLDRWLAGVEPEKSP